MKKLLILPLALGLQLAHADGALDYNGIKEHVSHGHHVRIVVDFAKCKSENQLVNTGLSFLGAYTPNEIIVQPNGEMAASFKHFTFNGIHNPGRAIYQYVTYAISPDNHVKVESRELDAANYATLSKTVKYECELGKSVNVFHVA